MRRADSHPAMAPLRPGISACLLGQAVRYDGGHKRDPFLAETLGRFVEWVPVCPEVELGLGVPREPIRLEGDAAAPRLVAAKSRRDLTRAMTRLARARAAELARLDLVGYVFKKDSPSCGMERVRVHGGGRPRRRGTGLFARALMERLPLLPVEEEGRLGDAALRASFVERVFAHARWKGALAAGMTRASPRASEPRGSQPSHGRVSRLQPSGATFPERTCPRTSRVAMRQVRKGRMTLVPIVSPAMLCWPQSGTASAPRNMSQAMAALSRKLNPAAPTPCSRKT